MALAILVLTVFPEASTWLGTLSALTIPGVVWTGWVLLLTSLGWIALAQAHLGASWRIGVDESARTALVQHGIFARSRNPIFLGMRLNLLGILLVAPNALTLAILVAGEVLMQVQVRLEEAYLEQVHGETYRAYRQQVPRWL